MKIDDTPETAALPDTNRARNFLGWGLAGVALALLAGVTVYSIYVAVHEPDPQETVILGQARIASGSSTGLRLLVRHRRSGDPVAGAQVGISLSGQQAGTVNLGKYRTDVTGSLGESIVIPELAPGIYQLCVETASSLGHDQVVKDVEIRQPVRVLLTSDKPVYQPGQTIHLRSLLLNRHTAKPLTNEGVTFEITDPKGNKIFKERRPSSGFGIASADCALASELNLGRYEVRAMGGGASATCILEVSQYVLPKFKVQISTDKPYYLPGESVAVSVTAHYFFGQPASGATVKLTATAFAEKPVLIGAGEGRTDGAGHFNLQLKLPDHPVGQPQKEEPALLDLTAEVRDTAGQVEKATRSLSVTGNDLEVAVIPEAGAWVPGVENIVYILTAHPDGRPVACELRLGTMTYRSGANGLCELRMTPKENNPSFEIQALDPAGRKRTVIYHSDTNGPVPAFLMRADRAVYQAGQTARISVISPGVSGPLFLDVLHEGQTMLTKSIPVVNGRAEYALRLPASLVGLLRLNLYGISSTGEDCGCSRLIYVDPASSLRIAGRLSQPVYRPGETARLELSVTDATGQPAPAAVGIVAVDESVLAMHENRPGRLTQFLEIEGELFKPRNEIKFFEASTKLLASGDQVLAAAYLAALVTPRGGPSLDDLVQGGYLPQGIVERLHSLRGTPVYERYRSDPKYAAMVRMLEGNPGFYSLREVTGPVKIRAVEAQRRAYFKGLRQWLWLGFLGLIFVSPGLLLLHYSRGAAGINPQLGSDGSIARYAQIAGSTHNLLAVLTLLPLVWYPIGIYIFETYTLPGSPWLLLGFESAAVVLTVFPQSLRTVTAEAGTPKTRLLSLRLFLGGYLTQFMVSRAGLVVMAQSPESLESFGIIWILAGLVAPLLVLACLSHHVQGQLAAQGITGRVIRTTVVEILIVFLLFFVLAGMLLPALATARAKSQAISFLNGLKQIDLASQVAAQDGLAAPGHPAAPRNRRDFPETLFWRPELITDDQGKATVEIPLADSITTWRAAIEGINRSGRLGHLELPIRVFQDFFVDLDLPVALALGDELSVPVVAHNHLAEPQEVRFTLAAGDWFESPVREMSLRLGPSEVKSVHFPLKVQRVGNHTLQVTARSSKMADAMERKVRVAPTGDRVDYTKNAVLKDAFADGFMIPEGAIPGSPRLGVKFYPSRFSEVVEGLEAIFQAPHGCFEQTSSTTYPNVLVLDYLRRTGQITPEIETKARKYVHDGYQRLLAFEVAGGGFEWFGHPPASIWLTAYGIMEFTDMARVHAVDEAVIARARQWLLKQQNRDGAWADHYRAGTGSGRGSVTAYVAWALAEAGDRSPKLDQALDFLRTHPLELSNTYARALAANAFLARNRNDTFGLELANRLKDAVVVDSPDTAHWTSQGHSMTYSSGSGLDTECTALCALALIKAGTWPQSVKQALTWITTHKLADGTHGSTQATILALRALLAASTSALGQEFESTVTVLLNHQPVESFRIHKDNSDVMKQLELSSFLRPGVNQLEFRQVPPGELPVQITGSYWRPASPKTVSLSKPLEPMRIDLEYDRTTLVVNDPLRCTVTAVNQTRQSAAMAILDLGIPAGFDVDLAAFETLRQDGQIAKHEATGNRVILYVRELPEAEPFQCTYTLRAKYPLRVTTPPSAVYEYYQPENRAQSRPVELQVSSAEN